MDLATSMAMSQQASTRSTIVTSIMKTQHQADAAFVNMIESVATNAPVPQGHGTKVDTSA